MGLAVDVLAARETMVKGTKIRMELDAKERPMHCHHEKLAVIDGRIAYVNGIDLIHPRAALR